MPGAGALALWPSAHAPRAEASSIEAQSFILRVRWRLVIEWVKAVVPDHLLELRNAV